MTRSRYSGARRRVAIEVDMDKCIGQRESPTPHNTLAHRHWERLGRDAKSGKADLLWHARSGKLSHTLKEILAMDRFTFSDGSMLVFSFSTVYVVDVNCSASLRGYFHRLGPTYAPMEAMFINQMRAMKEGWACGDK